MNARDSVKSVHLIGVAGTGMGAFAGLLKQAGYDVRGSDQNVYSPMKEKLAEWQIEVRMPYAAQNLLPKPDLTIVGNVIRSDNPEAVFAREQDFCQMSFPEALGALFLEKQKSLVVAGTHGKTTSSALLAHALLCAGRDPGFLIGGIPQNLGESFRCSEAPEHYFVVEGDEYDTAYFDKGPKFLHYRPHMVLCTSIEFDHADIYPNLEAIVGRFAELFSLLKPDGRLVYCAQDSNIPSALSKVELRGKPVSYGKSGDYQAAHVQEDASGLSFEVMYQGKPQGLIRLGLSGEHGVLNALGCYAILNEAGLSHDEIALGFASFRGVKRRMEEVGTVKGITVVDDFAHHPTAVRTTLEGARRRYGTRPIWALFEPRSASSCRKVFQNDYAQSFGAADRVLIAPTGRDLPKEIALDVGHLAQDLRDLSLSAFAMPSIETMVAMVKAEVPEDCVVMCLSNGSFGNIHRQILDALAER